MTIRSKSDLAKLYNVSRVTFAKYINGGALYLKLAETGYQKRKKLLTPLQVSLIIEHLGDPF
jgi:hypothetical protein